MEFDIKNNVNLQEKGSNLNNSIDNNSIGNITDLDNSSNSNDLNDLDNLIDSVEIPNENLHISTDDFQKSQIDFNLEANIDKNIIRTHTCKSCGMDITNNCLTCANCGTEYIDSSYSCAAITDCNVNDKGFISMKIVGNNSYGLQRSLLKTCSNYCTYRKVNTLKEMNNWNAQSTKHIPKNVIDEANEMFATIKKHKYVFRKDGKRGVLSACLYYACYANGISKTPSEIAQFSNIEEKFHSLGDRKLHDLNEKGIISIPIKINPISHYTNRYFELLGINVKYTSFIIDLISTAEKKKIHILHDSKNNTKCVGAIYMLVTRVPELRHITKDKIEQECSISKTTFIRYYNVLCEYYKKIKMVFKIHKIPMPIIWKDI